MTVLVEQDDDGLVVPQQNAIRVYENENGTITIAQDEPTTRDASIVTLTAEHADAVASAILRVAKLIREQRE